MTCTIEHTPSQLRAIAELERLAMNSPEAFRRLVAIRAEAEPGQRLRLATITMTGLAAAQERRFGNDYRAGELSLQSVRVAAAAGVLAHLASFDN